MEDTSLSAEVTYLQTSSGSVVATITASKAILTPNGWTKVDDTIYTKEYSWSDIAS